MDNLPGAHVDCENALRSFNKHMGYCVIYKDDKDNICYQKDRIKHITQPQNQQKTGQTDQSDEKNNNKEKPKPVPLFKFQGTWYERDVQAFAKVHGAKKNK